MSLCFSFVIGGITTTADGNSVSQIGGFGFQNTHAEIFTSGQHFVHIPLELAGIGVQGRSNAVCLRVKLLGNIHGSVQMVFLGEIRILSAPKIFFARYTLLVVYHGER